jgi:hypothetical protein
VFKILLLISGLAHASQLSPAPSPIFLKAGFSSILEFEEAPTQVVLGDSSNFQVERLRQSIIIKPMAHYATTNMFVYFKTKEPRLFVLTASEDAEPTFYRKFETFVPKVPKQRTPKTFVSGAQELSATFDKKKDYLTIDLRVSADSSGKVLPDWNLVKLQFKDQFFSASKIWSERREIQKDSEVRSRFIFVKPNVPKDLKGVILILPVRGGKAFAIRLAGGDR